MFRDGRRPEATPKSQHTKRCVLYTKMSKHEIYFAHNPRLTAQPRNHHPMKLCFVFFRLAMMRNILYIISIQTVFEHKPLFYFSYLSRTFLCAMDRSAFVFRRKSVPRGERRRPESRRRPLNLKILHLLKVPKAFAHFFGSLWVKLGIYSGF